MVGGYHCFIYYNFRDTAPLNQSPPSQGFLKIKNKPCSLELTVTSAAAAKTESTTDVIGRSFNTPLRASAVADLAQKDKSAQKSTGILVQKLVAESVETSSRASSVPGDVQDVTKRCRVSFYL